MPTLTELTALFDALPEVPPPTPRVRRKPPTNGGDKTQEKVTGKDVESKALGARGKVTVTSAPLTFISWFSLWPFHKKTAQQSIKQTPGRRPHPMAVIKQGKKVAIIAVVDSGSPSFFRFGQGDFSEWPMLG